MESKGLGKPKVSLQFELSNSGICQLVKAEAAVEETYMGEVEVEVDDDVVNATTNGTATEQERKLEEDTSSEEAKTEETAKNEEKEGNENSAEGDNETKADGDNETKSENGDKKKKGKKDAKNDKKKEEKKKKKTIKVEKVSGYDSLLFPLCKAVLSLCMYSNGLDFWISPPPQTCLCPTKGDEKDPQKSAWCECLL